MHRFVIGLMFAALVFAPAEAAAQFKIEHGELVVPSAVRFETGSAKLHPESNEALDFVVKFLTAKDSITTLRIEGHTDGSGDKVKETRLSCARALAVCKALVQRGIACERLIPVGFGPMKPVADGSTPEGKAANRRTVFAPAAMRGHAIGGMPLDGGGLAAGNPCK